MRWQGGREITHEAFFCSLIPHTFKLQINGLLHTPPSPTVLKEGENRGMKVHQALALTPTKSLFTTNQGICNLILCRSKVAFQGATMAFITETPEIWPPRLPGTGRMHYVSNHNTDKAIFK